MTIFIQGMCFTGKSTMGKILADYLKLRFIDSRDIFYNMYNVYDLDYLREHGRDAFKTAEKQAFMQDFGNCVVALSGSALYYEDMMTDLKKNHIIIWLDTEYDAIVSRKHQEESNGIIRPIVYPDGIDTFRALFDSRNIIYKKYATQVVNINPNDDYDSVLRKILISQYLSNI